MTTTTREGGTSIRLKGETTSEASGCLRRRKGQGSFEYILLVGAIILFVIIVVIITKTQVFSPAVGVTQNNEQQYGNAVNSMCNIAGQTCPAGYACYHANGSCLPNLLTDDPGFELNSSVWLNQDNPAQWHTITNAEHYSGQWSALFQNGYGTIYYNTPVIFTNVMGTYAFGVKTKVGAGTGGVLIALFNTSYSGGTCQPFGPDNFLIANTSTVSTTWTNIEGQATFNMPSCTSLEITKAQGTNPHAFVDDAYLIKIS